MKTILIYALVLVALTNEIHGQSGADEPTKICEPGAVTKVNRDVCTCSADGTLSKCEKIPDKYLNPDGSIKRPGEFNPLLRAKRDQICEPGTVRMNNCNSCRCSTDGTREACTRKACPAEPTRLRRDLSTRCEPNSTYTDGCNRCFCSADGHPIACTLMACSVSTIRNPNAHLLRTKRDRLCEPGTSRFLDCNRCRCNSDGTAEYCTKRECPVVPRSKRDEPFRCKPNESFKMECNTCVCSRDGRSAACTLKFCI